MLFHSAFIFGEMPFPVLISLSSPTLCQTLMVASHQKPERSPAQLVLQSPECMSVCVGARPLVAGHFY